MVMFNCRNRKGAEVATNSRTPSFRPQGLYSYLSRSCLCLVSYSPSEFVPCFSNSILQSGELVKKRDYWQLTVLEAGQSNVKTLINLCLARKRPLLLRGSLKDCVFKGHCLLHGGRVEGRGETLLNNSRWQFTV